jgi:Mg2+-importing ATPase
MKLILAHKNLNDDLLVDENYRKIDELTFDFQRRRMSVTLKTIKTAIFSICKGAVEEIMHLFHLCGYQWRNNEVTPEHDEHQQASLSKSSMPMDIASFAVAYRIFPG